MLKKYKFIIICLVLLLVVIAGIWYWRKNNNGNKENDKTAFETGFTLLDDEKNLVWSEMVELTREARERFEKKIQEIKADLAVRTLKEDRLADYNNLAIYQKYLGNYRESYNAYLESLKLESQARVAWQNFADTLLKMRALKSAEAAYQKAINLNKYIPESYIKLADFYKAMGDDKRVEETYKLAIETIKLSLESDTLVLSAYADWLAARKRYDEAIKILRELMAKQPGNKEAIEREIEKLKNKK